MASSNSQQEKWLIKIPYRGKENVYELSKEMSPPLNFESMARYTVLARANNEFSPRSAPFNFAAFKFIVDSNKWTKEILPDIYSRLDNRKITNQPKPYTAVFVK